MKKRKNLKNVEAIKIKRKKKLKHDFGIESPEMVGVEGGILSN